MIENRRVVECAGRALRLPPPAAMALCVALLVWGCSATNAADFAIAVVDFQPGDGAGFGQDRLPEIVLGPPMGGGAYAGSTDVLSLGVGGEIVLELGSDVVDGPGVDLIVFENAFLFSGQTFAEPAFVALSEDGLSFVELPCMTDLVDYPGCAGLAPVYANAETNAIDPRDPDVAGGDGFDLADFGLTRARYVRIRDAAVAAGPGGGTSEGFDLDAIAIVHGAAP